MKVHKNLNELPSFKNAVLTIGSFDGVHRGHQEIFKQLRTLSTQFGGESIVVSFHPHPRSVIYPKANDLKLLNSLDEKIRLLSRYQIDHLVLVPFSIEFSQQPAREYIEKFLLGKFNPKCIVVGYDHRFGLNREGNVDLLKEYCQATDLEVIQIQKETLDEITISSTKIREAIAKGDILEANQLLGHPYLIEGRVIHGKKVGQTIDFPTANIKLSDDKKLIPAEGVYAVNCDLNGLHKGGMMYIGSKKKKDGQRRVFMDIEVHVFDFEGNIYDDSLTVEIIEHVRDNRTFESLEALRAQLILDKERCKKILRYHDGIKPKPKVSIAILNYNGLDYLDRFLPSVQQSLTEDFECVVIDNGSTDDSLEFLEEWYPEIRVIALDKNYGFAEGYNKGIKEIDAPIIGILNSDVQPDSKWLKSLLVKLENDQTIACIQPKILSLEEKEYFEYAGASGGYLDKLGYPFCRGRIFDTIEQDNEQYESDEEVFWCSGAAMLIRKEAFEKSGGFDTSFFAHQEEIDLCWRLKRLGFKCLVAPTAKVYHLGGGTLDYSNPKKTYLNFRNNLTMLLKNQASGSLWFIFVARLFLDGVAGIKFLFGGQLKNTWAIIKAHFYVYGNILKILNSRKAFKKIISEHKAQDNSKTGRLNKALLFQYYLRGNKKFSDLDFEK